MTTAVERLIRLVFELYALALRNPRIYLRASSSLLKEHRTYQDTNVSNLAQTWADTFGNVLAGG
jgi:hypothetical protein